MTSRRVLMFLLLCGAASAQINNGGGGGGTPTAAAKVDIMDSSSNCVAAGANTTTYTCSLSPAITGYVTGIHYRFKADVANTAASTINFNSISAVTIKKAAGGVTTDIVANDLRAGQWVDLVYDGTNMQMQSTLGNVASTISGLTTNFITKATAATTIGNSLLDDGSTTANTLTYTGTAGISAKLFTTTSTTAGVIDFPQGSTNSAAAPCTTATSICEQAPTSVTSYLLTKPGAAPTIASIKITDACGSSICTESFRPKDLVLNVGTSDFVTAANTNLQNITGLGFTFPANVATVAAIDCDLEYSQQTAAVADAFGVQDVTVAPTSLYSTGFVQTAATTWVDTAAAALTTTTATNIIAMTPSAITTLWHARLHILIEQPSNASTSALNVMVKTGTSGDTVTVKRGSFCTVKFQ